MRKNIIVHEKEGRIDKEYDIFGRLFKDRVIWVNGEIKTSMASKIVAQLMLLDTRDPIAPIFMYINSPGGSVTAGLAIYDMMQIIEAPVYTVATGMACSMGAILLAGGAPGERSATPNAEIMIHQPSINDVSGQTTEVLIYAEVMKKCRKRLEEIMAHHTGQTLINIHKLMERDKFLDVQEAFELGIIDKVLQGKK